MSNDDEPFLKRWSRRKVEARQGAAADAVALPAGGQQAAVTRPGEAGAETRAETKAETRADGRAPPAQEPPRMLTEEDFADVDFDKLDMSSDYTRFMQKNVPEAIRQKALRRLWTSDPIFSSIEQFNEYGGDFTDKAVAVAPGTLQTAWRIGKGFLNDAEVAEWDKLGKPEVDAVAEAQGESEAAPEAQVADATSAGERAVAEAEPDAPVPDTVAAASDAEAAPEPEVAAEAGPEAGNTEPEQKKAKA